MDFEHLAVLLAAIAGVLGATAAVFKIWPERDSLVVVAAEGALEIQVKVNSRLEAEMNRLEARVGQLETQLSTVTSERDRLIDEATTLRARVTHLESEVTRLSNGH